jgi:hypothetical protein
VQNTFFRATSALVLVALVAAVPAAARADTERLEETIEVKRAETKDTKHPSLRFLKDNRVFLRECLDRVRLQVRLTRTDDAEVIDERLLRMQEMAAAIAAARDTVGTMHALTPGRDLLASVTELGALEGELDLMEQLLAEQRQRLLMLEEDFLGHQETALVVLVRGLDDRNAPATIVFSEESEFVRVPLTVEQRSSLSMGGIAQIYHEFVEPREHTYAVSFEGEGWGTVAPVPIAVLAARDRLTFLELDLSDLDNRSGSAGLQASVWYR